MEWFLANLGFVLDLTWLHLVQSVLPLLFGLLLSLPLGYTAWRLRPIRTAVLSVSSMLYTIPSLALFVLLPFVLGTSILDPMNLVAALTIYAVALLVRSVVDALESIDDGVRQAAVAMGYRPFRRFFAVDLPLAVPVLFAGLRVVSVSNISLASVGALIGVRNLGTLFTDGLLRFFLTEIVVGIVLTLLLAVLMDLLLVAAEQLLTPWHRAGGKRHVAGTDQGRQTRASAGERPDPAEAAVLP
ncbi:ABC-type proline/glycine betaine transport systems, permease component [Arthrobacter crystallopoietes BAB-32]|uniref:ABC-type proline/glycine betaine transport systems, permease component n=1 Tax=Arthrobacter crystallopoietes BAB-32 TaxID=1246476 RepID=N1V629_9MICC|nr:ABC transporter permease subunit [Arthrobacter crystallopoietes]EMY35469.1 ABC-type proline/glycine betaine transport systems, permease component [Arthrobacter crystallopoietes BAB-32]